MENKNVPNDYGENRSNRIHLAFFGPHYFPEETPADNELASMVSPHPFKKQRGEPALGPGGLGQTYITYNISLFLSGYKMFH